jgi:tRNA (guanosine-2'-O-)-methyltransferase
MRQVVDARLNSVTVLLDAPHDPHNGAAVIRTCDAFGIQTLHVVPDAEPFLVSRVVARGAKRWVDAEVHLTPDAAATHLLEAGFELIATHPEGELLPEDLSGIPRLCLLLGNEHRGIRPALTQAARRSVRIPMRGFVESLNVSVSAAILLHAATRGRAGDLTAEEREALYARWLFSTVKRAPVVLRELTPGVVQELTLATPGAAVVAQSPSVSPSAPAQDSALEGPSDTRGGLY